MPKFWKKNKTLLIISGCILLYSFLMVWLQTSDFVLSKVWFIEASKIIEKYIVAIISLWFVNFFTFKKDLNDEKLELNKKFDKTIKKYVLALSNDNARLINGCFKLLTNQFADPVNFETRDVKVPIVYKWKYTYDYEKIVKHTNNLHKEIQIVIDNQAIKNEELAVKAARDFQNQIG